MAESPPIPEQDVQKAAEAFGSIHLHILAEETLDGLHPGIQRPAAEFLKKLQEELTRTEEGHHR